MSEMRTWVLLDKAYGLLRETKEIMDNRSGDYGEECPFCMGELFEKDDIELIEFIGKHLGADRVG